MNLDRFLRGFPRIGDFSRKSIILLFAYYLRRYTGATQFKMSDIRDCFSTSNLRIPSDLSRLLKRLSTGRASPLIRGRQGSFALSAHGVSEVEAILPETVVVSSGAGSFLDAAIPHLKRVLVKVSDEQRREFIAEAISCLGVGAKRATITMTWLAVIDHLHEFVFKHHLSTFNAALARRPDRLSKLSVSSRDDFGEMREAQFIEVCRSAGVITRDVRKLLDEKLGFRNSCAHPSSLIVGDTKVVSFIEDLVDNAVSKHAI